MLKTDGGKAAGALATCAAVAAGCVPAWLIYRYGVDVPYWDQWDIAVFFEKLARGTLTPSDLFAQYNEYRQFFPNLIFVGLGRLTRWDVRYEMLVSLLLACLAAFNVRRLGALTGAARSRGGVLFVLASLLIFSAIQFENWLFGVQIVYFMPAACVTAGLLLAYDERVGARAALISCACLAAVSTFSSANGVLCWLVLPPALLAARPRARARYWLPPWGAGLALCVALYAHDYYKPAVNPSTLEALRHPFDALAYFVAFIGSPLAVGPRLLIAPVVGACALAAYALACAYLFKFRGDRALLRRAAAWVALGAYSLGTAALVTIGRVGIGVGQSLSSRYTTFSLYLLVSLVYLLPCVVEDAAGRGYLSAGRGALLRRLGVGAAALLLLAQVVIFAVVVRQGANRWRRGMLRAKACLLFIEVAPEERCLAEGLFPDLGALRERAESLDRMGYIRPPLVRGGRMRELAAAAGCSDEYGSFDLLPAEGGGAYVASGVARLPHRGEPADAVVLAYGAEGRDQTAFALAEVGARGEAGRAPAPDASDWRRTFPAALAPEAPGAEITAWAFDAEKGRAYMLCNTRGARRSE